MAREEFSTNLQQEVTCPICLDILKDPVTIGCGHNFCHGCITRHKKTSGDLFKCPICKSSTRKDAFIHNWQLRNLAERIRDMNLHGKEQRCPKHGEKLHYFCEEDGELLCVGCHDSKEHKSHNTSMIEEAAQHHQEQIRKHVEILEQKEKVLEHTKTQGEEKIYNFMAQVEFEKQRIHKEFEDFHKVMKKKKSILLSSIEQLDKEVTKECEYYYDVTQGQLNSLKNLKDSLKAKQQMPPTQLLQDIKGILQRSEEIQIQFHSQAPIPQDLEKQLDESKSKHDSVIKNLRKFEAFCSLPQDELQADGKKHQGKILQDRSTTHRQSRFLLGKNTPSTDRSSQPEPATPDSVTFDAASAHPSLKLSQDLKTVTAERIHQNSSGYPVEPQRFFPFYCVLGSPGFSTGRHSWEMELIRSRGQTCYVGATWEHALRRGSLTLEPASGFWVLCITQSKCQALTDGNTRKDLQFCPRRVGVCVDLEGKEVSFYDAATNNHIYTFQASFTGKIFPFFRLLFSGTQITLSP